MTVSLTFRYGWNQVNLSKIPIKHSLLVLAQNSSDTNSLATFQLSYLTMIYAHLIVFFYLGVVFDSDFRFHKHVSNICKSCFYHIRDLRWIRRHIPLSTAKTISNAVISSRLDYCNALLNNIAKQDLSKLQRVQNCLARVVLRAPRFSPSLSLLKQLHWLPVNYRIKFKLSTLTYRALAIHQPPYLASILHISNIPRQLRSSTSQQLSIPRTKLNLGKRAFSVAAPIIWNELPTTLKSCERLASFRKHLKTYIFKIAFPP